jgi:iron-siderophore transport system substrate-binding protein
MSTVRLPRGRRATALLTLLALAAPVALAACGDDDTTAGGEEAAAGGECTPLGEAPAGGEAFPVTIPHEHGETVVEDEPQRVITVGLSDQDPVLALGVTPVAVTHWYGDYDYDAWPWAQEALGDGEPVVLNDGAEWSGNASYNYEEIASYEPDLIVGMYVDMTEEQYDRLSAIAPTIAPSCEYPEYGMPWQLATRTVGQALGRADEAEALIDDVDAQFATAAAAHPELEGRQAVVAEYWEQGMSFARSANDPRTQFMEGLGFQLPEDIAELAGDQDGADISDEEMDMLDVDGVLLWNIGDDPSVRPDIEAKPLWDQLDVVNEGRVLFVDDPVVAGALTWSTVLSIPYAIEVLTPQIADAAAGTGS